MSDRSARQRHLLTSIRGGRFTRRYLRGWEIWSLWPPLLCYVLAVQVSALTVTSILISQQRITLDDYIMLGGITVLGIVKEELTRRVERMRRRFSDTPHLNMTSVWTLAAALVLPPGLVAVVVGALYAHLWFRTWHPLRSVRPWKLVFSASAVTLSCHTATGIQQLIGRTALAEAGLRAVALLVVAIVLYSVVNLGLVAGAIAMMTSERTARRLLGTLDDIELEYATLVMGAMAAIFLLRSPWAVSFVMVGLLVLHKVVLVRQLEEAASTDPKTGLLNPTAWQGLAKGEIERAKRDDVGVGVFMLDLDHFKHINDTYGHIAGDRVLAAVADRLRQEMREDDLLGRFGGEEFFALCPDLRVKDLRDVGERIRYAVEQLAIPVDEDNDVVINVTVSVGAAHFPGSGPELEDVLLAADNGLFAAKDGGRNRVEILQPGTKRQGCSDDSPASA